MAENRAKTTMRLNLKRLADPCLATLGVRRAKKYWATTGRKADSIELSPESSWGPWKQVSAAFVFVKLLIAKGERRENTSLLAEQ
jgi:hypothetical protein